MVLKLEGATEDHSPQSFQAVGLAEGETGCRSVVPSVAALQTIGAPDVLPPVKIDPPQLGNEGSGALPELLD